jgi:transketolase
MYEIGEKVALRSAFGPGLSSLANEWPDTVVVTADLGGSVNIGPFAEAHPDRYYNCGVAEQSMIGVAAGLAAQGFLPLAVTFGSFLGRTIDHIRQLVNHNKLKVIVVGSHGGISNAKDGPSAHAIEDVGIMRSMPVFTIVAPSDANQVVPALRAAMTHPGPVYLRLYREPLPVFAPPIEDFELGRAVVHRDGGDVTLLTYGPHVGFCLEWLDEWGDSVSADLIECHTIQPLDAETIRASVKKTGRVVTIEDHFERGGLGSAVAEVLDRSAPTIMRTVALRGYARSGDYYALRDAMGLGPQDLRAAIDETLTFSPN